MLFHFAVILFSLGVITRAYGQLRRNQISRYWFAVFSLFWLGIAVAALVPHATDRLASLLGVERGVDVFVYSSVLVLLYAVYRLFAHVQRLNEEITALVRTNALANAHAPSSVLKED